jgi:hypothetical protein
MSGASHRQKVRKNDTALIALVFGILALFLGLSCHALAGRVSRI